MKRTTRILAGAVGAIALVGGGFFFAGTGAASAQAAGSTTYQATLNPLNNQTGATGTVTITINGSKATVKEQVSGLAATFMKGPFPHVQHIHIDGASGCPPQSADKSGDGVVSVAEGKPFYGAIGTTLSVSGDTTPAAATDVKIAPSGASFTYNRTVDLDAATLSSIKAGTAAVVVHGLDPTKLSPKAQGEMSELVPSLPLAATAPALCGKLAASQMSAVPSGGVATGGGSTSGFQNTGVLVGGLVLAAGGVVLFANRRRFTAGS